MNENYFEIYSEFKDCFVECKKIAFDILYSSFPIHIENEIARRNARC